MHILMYAVLQSGKLLTKLTSPFVCVVNVYKSVHTKFMHIEYLSLLPLTFFLVSPCAPCVPKKGAVHVCIDVRMCICRCVC